MENSINTLLDILEQQERVYESILKLAKDKTEVIVAGRIAELESLVKLEQALVVQIGRLEQQREEAV
ncbi:MAG: flagellar export chaperone FlgN, partial [Clostridia bacterium]